MDTYKSIENSLLFARYRTADFHKLTNYQASSPRSPDSRVAHVSSAADGTLAWRSISTADKRSVSSKRTSVCSSHGQQNSDGILRRITSCSSVEEISYGIAQSFLESPLQCSSPLEKRDDDPASLGGEFNSCKCCCRCGRTRRLSSSSQKRRSRSYSPIRTYVSELSASGEEDVLIPDPVKTNVSRVNRPGDAPLERLPVELLDNVIAQLALDIPPADYSLRNIDLMSCLLTSRTIYAATVATLYNRVTIPHSLIFSKFLSHITENQGLGSIVRRLDLSHFTSVGMGRTRQLDNEIQNMTSTNLSKCLELMPRIQEVLLQEHLENDLDEAVLRKLFYGLPNLRALDFCASSSNSFVNAFAGALSNLTPEIAPMLGIRRLSLHECFTLSSNSLELLLPRLPRLTHLDLCHTRVTDKAITSIPTSSCLTHLNLGRCAQITGQGIASFLGTHPAVIGLIYLNLSCDTSRYRLLKEDDVEEVLSCLPPTLRSLNLSGAKIRPVHLPSLLLLTKHLEELSIGHAELSLDQVNSLFLPRPPPSHSDGMSTEEMNWVPSSLHYLDLTGVASVTQSALFSSNCALLNPMTSPLEVIELGEKVISALLKCKSTNTKMGWVIKDLGRRGWYVREPTRQTEMGINGRRSWKMGAMWWGMRKVPVAYVDVGGLYGHYMFKK